MAKKSKRSVEKHSNRITVNDDKSVLSGVTPRNIGVLDMIIAFDTTGSMASYIGQFVKKCLILFPAYSSITKTLGWELLLLVTIVT